MKATGRVIQSADRCDGLSGAPQSDPKGSVPPNRRRPQDSANLDELIEHLERSTRLGGGEAARVVGEVLEYFSESMEEFVRRRHAELQAEEHKNAEIFERIAEELRARRFAAPALTLRQIRRLIYG